MAERPVREPSSPASVENSTDVAQCEVHGDQSLVQVAFANVRNGEVGPVHPESLSQEYAGIVVQGGGGLSRGQKVAGIRSRTSENGKLDPTWSYTEYLAVGSDQLQRLPQDTPLKHGALVGMVAACLDGLNYISLVRLILMITQSLLLLLMLVLAPSNLPLRKTELPWPH